MTTFSGSKWMVLGIGILLLFMFGGLDFMLDNPIIFIFVGLIFLMSGGKK